MFTLHRVYAHVTTGIGLQLKVKICNAYEMIFLYIVPAIFQVMLKDCVLRIMSGLLAEF